jgi:hypothetical protein
MEIFQLADFKKVQDKTASSFLEKKKERYHEDR